MTWWADYNLTYAEPKPGQCRLDVGAWVTIVNQSGAAYDEREAEAHRGRRAARAAARLPGRGARGPGARPGGEGRRASRRRPSSSTTSTRWAARPRSRRTRPSRSSSSPRPPAWAARRSSSTPARRCAFPYYGSPMTDRNFGVQSNRKVDVYLRMKNAQANGLGMPLPAGKLRVSKRDDADGSLEFIGEDLIDHTRARRDGAGEAGLRLRRRGRAQAARLPRRHLRQVDRGGHRDPRAQPEARRGRDGRS